MGELTSALRRVELDLDDAPQWLAEHGFTDGLPVIAPEPRLVDAALASCGRDPAEVLGEGFADQRQDMVVVRGIAVHGVCPHHLVPFRGTAHVAYVPGGRLHGFGRIARLVDAIGHRFTYQEWMTRDIADALVIHGKAQGAACVIEAEQLCLLLGEDRRGDERVYTQAFAGCFNQDPQLRSEFMQAIGSRGA